MKKIFTLLVAAFSATTMMAQMHGAMKFVGASTMQVSDMNLSNESDTVSFVMNDMTSGDITLPEMKGMLTIPSFTIKGATFSMGSNHVVEFANQQFASTVNVNGADKTITGTSLTGTYNMADNSFSLTAVFKYGAMPMPMTYNVKGYYVNGVSGAISVTVGGQFTYDNSSVTYSVRKYKEDDVEKLDVEVPYYTLDNTIMGNLGLGKYVVKGLVYDESKGGFYRDYANDGLSFHFTAEKGGTKTMDADYTFNSDKPNNILVKYNGSTVEQIVNTFQMGDMPFGIVSTFGNSATGINGVHVANKYNDGKMYNLAGQRVGNDYKGIVIVNGKKYIKK